MSSVLIIPSLCLKLFCHAAAREHTLPWDELKENILIWCMTQDCQPFHRQSSIFTLEVPDQAISPLTLLRGKEICEKFNIKKGTRGESCISWITISQHLYPVQQALPLLSSSRLIHPYDCLKSRKSYKYSAPKYFKL